MGNTTTRIVGTFTDDAGVVHNFDFLFDLVDVNQNDTAICRLMEIDGITYECGYEKMDDGYWHFSVEYFDTRLRLRF
ncbi:hypothetical protein M9Y10_026435 [Tritrichomonas musculus]|uniref:Uncharacterized protein n=1 Tax=Tritrichomonas musculus TaxID=1915356 RepID=A0ABR2H7J2_9EUKA